MMVYVKAVLIMVTGVVFGVAGVALALSSEVLGGLFSVGFGWICWFGGLLLFPPRWDAEPERGEIEVGGVCTPALIFRVRRQDRLAFLSVVPLLLLGMALGLIWLLAGGLSLAQGDGLGGFALIPGAVLTAATGLLGAMGVAAWRRRRRPQYVACTADMIRIEFPASSGDVPWDDIVGFSEFEVNSQKFFGLALRSGATAEIRTSRWMRRLNRAFGAELYVGFNSLLSHPDLLADAVQTYRSSPQAREALRAT
ncbi:hypothetical protein [Spirillospora sp. CA-294931]|uniref:hypothetical protein n=1 Tax=Spirillospora sp. CA-294931 TaxID=3240042 RepID=UPI003D918C6A